MRRVGVAWFTVWVLCGEGLWYVQSGLRNPVTRLPWLQAVHGNAHREIVKYCVEMARPCSTIPKGSKYHYSIYIGPKVMIQ